MSGREKIKERMENTRCNQASYSFLRNHNILVMQNVTKGTIENHYIDLSSRRM